jgi:hypothetical protein
VRLSVSKQSPTSGRRSPEGFARLQVQAPPPRQPNSLLAHDFHEAFNVEEIPTATATASVLCICPALVLLYDRNYALDKAAMPELITSWPNAAI